MVVAETAIQAIPPVVPEAQPGLVAPADLLKKRLAYLPLCLYPRMEVSRSRLSFPPMVAKAAQLAQWVDKADRRTVCRRRLAAQADKAE
jgi:hypothetical protein